MLFGIGRRRRCSRKGWIFTDTNCSSCSREYNGAYSGQDRGPDTEDPGQNKIYRLRGLCRAASRAFCLAISHPDDEPDKTARDGAPGAAGKDRRERCPALPLATRMETRLPWRPTRGSLTSPSHVVRNRTLGPPLENHPETPPSSRR